MEKREKIISLWFNMWLRGKDMGILDIFSPDVLYIESWGPQYSGIEKVKHWFEEWNTRGTVVQWDIKLFWQIKVVYPICFGNSCTFRNSVDVRIPFPHKLPKPHFN